MSQPQSSRSAVRSASFSTYWKPGSRSGSAPMSPPPWTLFWPRSGFRPLPYRPTWPVSSGEVDQREDVVDRVVVLGDAERPADHRPVGLRVGVGQLADRGRGHARLALGVLERVRLDLRPVGLEVGRRAVDELGVREAGVDDLAPDRVRERDVRADVEAQPHVGPLGRARPARVDRVQPRAVADAAAGGGGRRSDASPGRCEPQRTIRSVSSASRYELVPPPAPNTVARPATEGACQVRLQLSMLLLPRTCRANFCAA